MTNEHLDHVATCRRMIEPLEVSLDSLILKNNGTSRVQGSADQAMGPLRAHAGVADGRLAQPQEPRSLPGALAKEFAKCGLTPLLRNRYNSFASETRHTAAEVLAESVLRNLSARELPLKIEAIAEELGVQALVLDDTINAAGGLEYRNSKITIVYGDADPRARRETIAHELGHYLLRNVAEMPFKDQLGDPTIESFCDQFARHLLIPKAWLAAREPVTTTIDTALEISEITGTSVATAATALLDTHESWPAFLLLWQPSRVKARNWLVSHCISQAQASYRATPSTTAALNAATFTSRRVTFSLIRNGRMCDATADVVRTNTTVAAWVHYLRPRH